MRSGSEGGIQGRGADPQLAGESGKRGGPLFVGELAKRCGDLFQHLASAPIGVFGAHAGGQVALGEEGPPAGELAARAV